uniref:DUF4220 domain-containing protein n=1 Tax=Arundo donax TaxID=35708 RepID=A0A0A8Y0M8_ARUDO
MPVAPSREVATALSRYCAYLVAFHPELLPDDIDGTEFLYKNTKKELKKEMGCFGYYVSQQGARCRKLMEIAARQQEEVEQAVEMMEPAGRQRQALETTTALRKGARLGKVLVEKYEAAADEDARARVWKLLADLWTEVVVYAAPADGELHVKAHKEALARGGDFITLLWALATHTGITRGPAAAMPVEFV